MKFRLVKLIVLIFLATHLITNCKIRQLDTSETLESAERGNDTPSRLGISNITSYQKLPSGTETNPIRPALRPWSGFYWPDVLGGVALRWQSANIQWRQMLNFTVGFRYEPYEFLTPKQVFLMSDQSIAELSPAEKIDILFGRYNFPFAREEITKMMMESAKYWHGLCDGWAQSSAEIKEPGPFVTVNMDDIEAFDGQTAMDRSAAYRKVTFYRDDIKALLAWAYAGKVNQSTGKLQVAGQFCRADDDTEDPLADYNCRNLNAGTFHLGMTQIIGSEKKNLVMDIDSTNLVWSHTVVSFNYKLSAPHQLVGKSHQDKHQNRLSWYKATANQMDEAKSRKKFGKVPGNARGTRSRYTAKKIDETIYPPARLAVEEVNVQMNVTVIDNSRPEVDGNDFDTKEIKLYYTIELDAYGRIVGGLWKGRNHYPLVGETKHPDIVWRLKSGYDYSGPHFSLSVIKELAEKSLKNLGAELPFQ